MRYRNWISRSAVLACALGMLGVAHGAPPGSAPAPDRAPDPVDELLGKLQAMPGLYANFTESKTIGLLAVPLINHGTVHYDPPGRLLRTVSKPHNSQVLLRDDAIWLREGGTAERIDLTAHPAARSFVGSFRALLAGDRKALAEHFELGLKTAADARWTLRLRPTTEAMAKIVTGIKISGHDEVVERLVIEEATGDVSDTRFTQVDTQRRYSDHEVATLFAPPA